MLYVFVYRVFVLMCNHNQLPNTPSPLANTTTTHTTTTNTNTATTVSHKPILLQPSQSYAYTQNPANATTTLNNSTHHNNTHTTNINSKSIYEAPQTFFSLLGQYLTTSSHREANDYGSLKFTTTEEAAEVEKLLFRIQVSVTQCTVYTLYIICTYTHAYSTLALLTCFSMA